jgi:NADH-quinone oxidoreductase subunit H
MQMPIEMTLTQTVVMALIQIVVIIAFIMMLVPMLTFAERKVIAFVQQRLGATRTAGGLWLHGETGRRSLLGGLNKVMWWMGKVPVLSFFRGIPVFAADGLKLVTKEDIIPDKADKLVFVLSPAIAMIPAFVVFAAVAFFPGELGHMPQGLPIIGGLPVTGYLTNINVGLLFILAVSSVGVYGIVLGAWASNSKYPLLGGLRSAAQIISYEVPLTLSLLVPVVLTGSLNFSDMSVKLATGVSPLAIIPLTIGSVLYTVCGFAETNRVPFDLAEAETELVSGFHTEYTGMKFGWYFLAEYANMIVVSALASAFFLGGHFLLPFGLQNLLGPWLGHMWAPLNEPHLIFFLGKIFFMLFLFLWVRATLPRYRYDQLMNVGWKWLIPVTLGNLFLACVIRYFC